MFDIWRFFRKKTAATETINWTKGTAVGSAHRQFQPGNCRADFEHETRIDFFTMFFDDQLLTDITTETNRYAQQNNSNLMMTSDELMTFFGTLLVSGCSKLPHRRMYWNDTDDVHKIVRKAI